ncbi:MAG: TolC family protein [Planctomycetes bacterium]|nr:TolC family protein [Planctomycetota bacterium]
MRPPQTQRRLMRLGLLLVMALTPCALTVQAQHVHHAPSYQVLTLEDCIGLGLDKQPAVIAARASLAAAQAGLQGIDNLGCVARCLAKDIDIRREQAVRGVAIATGGVVTAEFETRYAVTRNYFSTMYAMAQHDVLKRVVERIESMRKQAKDLLKLGDPKLKITAIDLLKLELAVKEYKTRSIEAEVGMKKAIAALREAMGFDAGFCFAVYPIPLPDVQPTYELCALIDMALSRRGEMAQAALAYQVTTLEVNAQGVKKGLQVNTFAKAGDPHANPIPTGVSNKDYRPGAIGLETPPYLAGHKADRVARAQELNNRAGAVVLKTRNLISLETEVMYYKWEESYRKAAGLKELRELAGKLIKSVQDEFVQGSIDGGEYLKTNAQEEKIQSELNEALYTHVLALAALERVTAGGFRPDYSRRPGKDLPGKDLPVPEKMIP